MANRHILLSTASLAAIIAALLPLGALAADPLAAPPASALPAVSAPNGKAGAFAGSVGNATAVGAFGSLALPLRGSFGAQVDGIGGTAGGAEFYGVAGHLFWRDPARGLIGLYSSYLAWGTNATIAATTPSGGVIDITGATVGKVGVEAEAYLDRFSLEGLAAYQFGTNGGPAGKATVAFYPTDDIRLDLGVRYLQGNGGYVAAGAEWQPAATHMSIFADATAGQGGSWSALGGLKVYFGAADKSLIRRHREDDPDVELPADLYTTVGDAYCPVGTHLTSNFCDGAL